MPEWLTLSQLLWTLSVIPVAVICAAILSFLFQPGSEPLRVRVKSWWRSRRAKKHAARVLNFEREWNPRGLVFRQWIVRKEESQRMRKASETCKPA